MLLTLPKNVPCTQATVALAFLKDRGCVEVEQRRCWPASRFVLEDAPCEWHALAFQCKAEGDPATRLCAQTPHVRHVRALFAAGDPSYVATQPLAKRAAWERPTQRLPRIARSEPGRRFSAGFNNGQSITRQIRDGLESLLRNLSFSDRPAQNRP